MVQESDNSTASGETPAGQMDDINIPLVAASVAFFAALLAVTIVGLQAVFYNFQAAELESPAKRLAQDDPRTELGKILQSQREELAGAGWARNTGGSGGATTTPAGGATATGTAASQATAPHIRRIPIDRAIDKIIAEYALAQGTGTK